MKSNPAVGFIYFFFICVLASLLLILLSPHPYYFFSGPAITLIAVLRESWVWEKGPCSSEILDDPLVLFQENCISKEMSYCLHPKL